MRCLLIQPNVFLRRSTKRPASSYKLIGEDALMEKYISRCARRSCTIWRRRRHVQEACWQERSIISLGITALNARETSSDDLPGSQLQTLRRVPLGHGRSCRVDHRSLRICRSSFQLSSQCQLKSIRLAALLAAYLFSLGPAIMGPAPSLSAIIVAAQSPVRTIIGRGEMQLAT